MALLINLKEFLATPEPPDLGPGPRNGVQPETELNANMHRALHRVGIPQNRHPLIRAVILLWHDHLDAAHSIAQAINNADGALVHAIMHRREPDFGNAAYWFRRVGNHPVFAEIARRVGPLEFGRNQSRRTALLPNGAWDPFAFVQACQQAWEGPGSADDIRLLREIQRAEFETLLGWFSRPM